MAKSNAEDDATQSQNQELRENLQSAYAFVEGQKAVQSFAAFTIEDATDLFIERIEGKGTPSRPNVLDRITRLKEEVLAAVARTKALPPETFRNPDNTHDVNTTL